MLQKQDKGLSSKLWAYLKTLLICNIMFIKKPGDKSFVYNKSK